MCTTHQSAAPTIATRIPADRTIPGLEYGGHHNGRRYVRPTGTTLWGLAREVSGDYLPDDATLLDELTAELDRWNHLPEAFHPAVAVLLEDGGIRAVLEADELREALPDWSRERLAEWLEEYGAGSAGTLYGRHVRAALTACRRDVGTDQALERMAGNIVQALEALEGLGGGLPREELRQRLHRAAGLLAEAREELDRLPLRADATFCGTYGRLEAGASFLREIGEGLEELGAEATLSTLASVKRIVEPTWVNLGRLELARNGEADQAVPS